MKYLVILLMLVGCLRNPVGISPIEVYHGVDSLQYSGYFSILEQSAWTGEYGVTFYTAAYNTGEKDWYGHPEIDIHTSDVLLTTFNEETLLSHGEGVLTTGLDSYSIIPVDTVEFIPPLEYRETLTFAPVVRADLKRYYYVLWSFE